MPLCMCQALDLLFCINPMLQLVMSFEQNARQSQEGAPLAPGALRQQAPAGRQGGALVKHMHGLVPKKWKCLLRGKVQNSGLTGAAVVPAVMPQHQYPLATQGGACAKAPPLPACQNAATRCLPFPSSIWQFQVRCRAHSR